MNNWHWIFVGFTFGMWAALALFMHFYFSEQRRVAENGYIEIDGAFYRLSRFGGEAEGVKRGLE